MSGSSSKMQGGETTVVRLVYISTIVNQLINYRILTIITGNVKSSISIYVYFIDLPWNKNIQLKLQISVYFALHNTLYMANGNSWRLELSLWMLFASKCHWQNILQIYVSWHLGLKGSTNYRMHYIFQRTGTDFFWNSANICSSNNQRKIWHF